MRPLLADVNFRGPIFRGIKRHYPEIDIVRAQDVELSEADDPELLEWAAKEGRVVVTHDANTVAGHAHNRVRAGLPMPGVLEISRSIGDGEAIKQIALVVGASLETEWDGQVRYLPLKPTRRR